MTDVIEIPTVNLQGLSQLPKDSFFELSVVETAGLLLEF